MNIFSRMRRGAAHLYILEREESYKRWNLLGRIPTSTHGHAIVQEASLHHTDERNLHKKLPGSFAAINTMLLE
jgi:hypothetical protein